MITAKTKQTIFHIVGCLAVLAMVAFGAYKLGFVLRPVGQGNSDKAFTQVDSFYSLPENSVEVIIYGSSHALYGVNPMVMYDQFGIGSYNYSWCWQKINTTKLFLQDSLLTQSPKVVVIEAFHAHMVLEDLDMNGEIYYTRFLHNTKYRTDYLKQCFGNDLERWLSYYMPLAAFHANWTNITQKSFTPIVNTHAYLMGYAKKKKVKPITLPDKSAIRDLKLSEKAIAELDEIVDLCKSQGIEVLFITVPYGKKDSNTKAIAEYAKERECAYINTLDYIDEIGIDPKTDFADKGHLNVDGAAKVSAFLGQYLSEHYDLTDMRQVADNLWEQ